MKIPAIVFLFSTASMAFGATGLDIGSGDSYIFQKPTPAPAATPAPTPTPAPAPTPAPFFPGDKVVLTQDVPLFFKGNLVAMGHKGAELTVYECAGKKISVYVENANVDQKAICCEVTPQQIVLEAAFAKTPERVAAQKAEEARVAAVKTEADNQKAEADKAAAAQAAADRDAKIADLKNQVAKCYARINIIKRRNSMGGGYIRQYQVDLTNEQKKLEALRDQLAALGVKVTIPSTMLE